MTLELAWLKRWLIEVVRVLVCVWFVIGVVFFALVPLMVLTYLTEEDTK